MIDADRQRVPKGSWRWSLRIAERTTWVSWGVLFLVLHVADLDPTTYRNGVILAAVLGASTGIAFRRILPSLRRDTRIAWAGVVLGTAVGIGTFALLRRDVPSAHLFFLPVIVLTALVGNVRYAVAAAVVSVAGYLGVAALTDTTPSFVVGGMNAIVFLFAGYVAGSLADQMRSHYRRELEEHNVAMATGHRLSAVLDAVEEAIIFSDRQGSVRMVNLRAAQMFDLEGSDHLGAPGVQLARLLARRMEDPEGFMEMFQELRDEPETELRAEVEQILPTRRALRLLSRPARDDAGELVGRIDVYTDISEGVRRAAEVERLYEEARSTAESYQRALLPSAVPALPRVSLVAHYVPAAGRRAVCGDFYDFLTMKDGKIAVVLGDVVGVGPAAVNDAALTRYTLGSLVRSESDPARLLEITNVLVRQRLGNERFIRLFIGLLDPERATLKYASAGHVPPLLYRAKDQDVEWLGEGGIPLGVEHDAEYKTGHSELDPGDSLFFYTDGVTEAPRHGRPLGQGKLSDLVRQYGVGTPGELVQAIRRSVEAWVDGDLRDDLAMVGCQVVSDLAVEPTRELVLPNEAVRIREVRSFVAEFLADLRAPVDISSEVLLAVSEAVGNAVKYGKRASGRSELRVRCAVEERDLVLTVTDDGPGFDVAAQGELGLPDRFASGGRGLFLMRRMMDVVDIQSSGEGTTVRLERQVFEEAPRVETIPGPPGA